MTNLDGAEVSVWRPKPKPDVRVMKLERGGPLPGGCSVHRIQVMCWERDYEERDADGYVEEVWFRGGDSHFSVPWGNYVILDDENNFRGSVNPSYFEREHERIG